MQRSSNNPAGKQYPSVQAPQQSSQKINRPSANQDNNPEGKKLNQTSEQKMPVSKPNSIQNQSEFEFENINESTTSTPGFDFSSQPFDKKIFLLDNPQFSYNCFLNVCIQILWHMDGFEDVIRAFVNLKNAKPGLASALSKIFKTINSTNSKQDRENGFLKTYDVQQIREELAVETKDSGLFNLGDKADATEAMIYIFESMCKQLCGPKQEIKQEIQTSTGVSIIKRKICTCEVHKACHTSLYQQVKCQLCHSVRITQLDDNYFLQQVGVKEFLTFADKEDLRRHTVNGIAPTEEQRSPESLIHLISGQFFNIFKCTNLKLTDGQSFSCPKEKNACKISNAKEVTSRVRLTDPVPQILMFAIGWQDEDILHTNCLKMLASLPPYCYPSNLFDTQNYQITYKLCGIVGYTGSHYLTFLKIAKTNDRGEVNKTWSLFNDDQFQIFEEFDQIAQFMIESCIVPTMILYEKCEYVNNKSQKDVQVILEDDQWLMMYLQALELENSVGNMLADEQLMQEQMEIMRQLERQNSGNPEPQSKSNQNIQSITRMPSNQSEQSQPSMKQQTSHQSAASNQPSTTQPATINWGIPTLLTDEKDEKGNVDTDDESDPVKQEIKTTTGQPAKKK